ncbi:DUF6223 family protein [Streptomyces tendae]|uniref:DUF6223 family protein n=1 Tax=Streptomyces tendae TaxID=1932 RepID=UPI0013310E10|nr:DUF6223 family protein [Streptomyces tendae]
MNASQALEVAAEGGIIGDGRTGANLALGVGLIGLAIGWAALMRITGRISIGNARTGGLSAMGAGVAGMVLAVLHLATSSGGPGTGNGLVGAIAAVPLGLVAVVVGRRALALSRHTGPATEHSTHERTAEPH